VHQADPIAAAEAKGAALMSDAALRTSRQAPARQVAGPEGPGHGAWTRRRDRRGSWFVAPFLLVFTLFSVVPIGYALYDSLYTTRIIGGTVFSGFSNYSQVFTSGPFWSGGIRVIIFGAIQIPVMLAIAFFFACIFDLGLVRFGSTFRTIFFIPFAVPIVVAAIMWGFLLEPSYGPVTHLANLFGFQGTNFLSSGLILPSIIVIAIWEWTGYNCIILYTALRSVPRDVVEAAILDDTPLWKIILRIKLPMVRPAIVMLVFLNSIGALQLFIEPQILSYQGGTITNTWTPIVDIYNTSIANAQYNLGAAMAVVFGLAIIAVSVASIAFRRRGELR
jgi:multiple sugar transport system permease protein